MATNQPTKPACGIPRDRKAEYQRNRASSLRYCKEHRVERSERAKRWIKENPERVRFAHVRRASGYDPQCITLDQWKAMCEMYGGRCLKCGEIKPLTMDHVIPIRNGGNYRIENIQPLCRACNSGKKFGHSDYRADFAARVASGEFSQIMSGKQIRLF